MIPDAKHPIWGVVKLALPLAFATIALVVMLVCNYNAVDYRDAVTTLVVAIAGACGIGVVSKLTGKKEE